MKFNENSSKILLAMTFGFLGYFINSYSVELAFGLYLSFGGIVVALSLMYLGPGFAVLSSLLAASYTWTLFHHPYSIVIWVCEIIFLGFFYYKNRRRSLIYIDAIYWLFLGMPLALFFHFYILKITFSDSMLIAAKQALNGINNVLVANLLYVFFANFTQVSFFKARHKFKTNKIIALLLNSVLLVLTTIFIFFLTKMEVRDSSTTVKNEFKDATNTFDLVISSWFSSHIGAVMSVASSGESHPTVSSQHLQTGLVPPSR